MKRKLRCACGHFFATYAVTPSKPPVQCPNCKKVNPLDLDEAIIKKRLEQLRVSR